MKHPQYSQLDSIRFQSSTLKNIDKYTENIPIKNLIIGKKDVENPLVLRKPFMIPPYITRNLDGDTFTGISLGSSISGMNVNLHGKMNRDLEEILKIHSPPVFYDLCSCRAIPDISLLERSDCIWLELGQGEGYMPNEESTSVRRSYPEIEGPKDLIHLIRMLREIRSIPLIVSIRAIDLVSDIDHVLVTEADAVHVRCGFDRNGTEGDSFFGFTGEPVTAIINAVEHMKTFKCRENGVRFIFSGPSRNAADIMKYAALGVDGFGMDPFIAREILNVEDNDKKKKMDWAMIGEILQLSIESLEKEILHHLDVLNTASMDLLDRSMLVVDSYHTAALTGLPLAGYGREIPFWRH